MRVPPRSGAAVAWLDAWRSGACGPDRLAAGIVGDDALHLLTWPGEPDALTWPAALPRLLEAGPLLPRLALPVPGDPAGLRAVAPAALAAGEAVHLPGAGLLLVPSAAGTDVDTVVRWDVLPAPDARWAAVERGATGTPGLAAADLTAADRDLRRAVLETADAMAALGLERARDDVSARLEAVERRLADHPLPPTLPQRAVVMLRTAGRLLAAVDLALEDDGAALTAGEAAARRETLWPLMTACRRALEAAYGAGANGAAG